MNTDNITIKLPAAGVLTVTKDKKFLLARRHSSAYFLGGYWSVPSGEMNPGETSEECAKREFFEETGHYIPDETELIFIEKYFADDRWYYLFAYVCDEEFEVQIDFEHDDYGWFDEDSLPEPIAPQITDAIFKTRYLFV